MIEKERNLQYPKEKVKSYPVLREQESIRFLFPSRVTMPTGVSQTLKGAVSHLRSVARILPASMYAAIGKY